MNLIYLGHSCFLIKTSNGRRILLDPFCENIGYKSYKEHVDIITVSNAHFEHNFSMNIDNDTKILNTPSNYETYYCKIEGLPSFHDKLHGLKRGPNIIFKLFIDGISICHLGDIGHIPSDSLVQRIGKVDILMIPIGGNYTINASEATHICNIIKSKYVIPIHYMTNKLCYKLDDPSEFIISMKNIKKLKNNDISTDNLDFNVPNYNTVLLFK